MDRYRCIVVPPYRSSLTPRHAIFISLLVWGVSSLIFIPIILFFQEVFYDDQIACTFVSPIKNFSSFFIIPVMILTTLFPMVLLVYHYQRIFHKIISTKNTWASSCVMVSAIEVKNPQNRRQSEISMSDIFVPWPRRFSTQLTTSPNGVRQNSLSQHEEIRVNKHVKVVRILFLNVVVVLVMWLPITIIVFLIYIDGKRFFNKHNFFLRSNHFIIALMVAFLNTVVNPIVYGVLSDTFKASLVRMFCGKRGEEDLVEVRDPVTPSSGRNNVTTAKSTRKQSFNNSLSDN